MLVVIWGINISDELIKILSFVVPAITLSILVLNIISNKKTSFIGSLLFLASLFALLVRNVHLPFFQNLNNQYFNPIPYINRYIYIAILLGFIVSLLSYIFHTKDNNTKQLILREAKKYEQTNVLAYINKRGKLLQVSKRIHEMVYNPQKDLALKLVEVGSEAFGPKGVMKKIINYSAKLNEAVDYKFIFDNNLEVIIRMVKKEIQYKEKLIGYILLDPIVTNEYNEDYNDLKRSFYIYLDLLDEPLAYFDEEQKAYVASRNLMHYLQTENNTIPLEQLRQIMHKDDLGIFDSRQIEANKYQKIQYRLLTANGYAWFEEGFGSFFGKKYIVTKKINAEESNAINIGTYKNYVAKIEENISNNLVFSIALLNLHTVPELISEYGKDFANLVLNRYFEKISSGVLKDRLSIYKVSNTEFALIIEGEEYYDVVVRDLHSNSSNLLSQEIVINKNKVVVKAHVAMVLSKQVANLDAQKIMKVAFETIKEASDPKFLKEY